MRPPKSDLLKMQKPARYTGGEVNVAAKEITDDMTRFAFCFPDVYEIGMSHLGLQLIYGMLNERADTFCERAFMPWIDMVDYLKETNTPLFAVETGAYLKDFDMLGFTLQYEMSYSNVLAMLDFAQIPLKSLDREEHHPIVCAGGPCVVNPEPMAEFIDFFYIGDAEASLNTVMDRFAEWKNSGSTKKEFLESIADISGVYVPSFYSATYNSDGTLSSFCPANEKAPACVERALTPTLEYYPDKMISPLTEAVHNRAVVEIARGCIRGCRFCQAGYIYRPMRERGIEALLEKAENLLQATGHEELSLLSLSACDYSNFNNLVDALLQLTEKDMVSLSLPSTRLDAIDTLAKVKSVRKSSLTVAPEAGSQRMRDVINKNLTEEDILEGCYRAFLAGIDKIKLYFIGGLPTETEKDREDIIDLCNKIVDTYYRLTYEERKRPVSVSVSTACFVPKPFTPFQWAKQVAADDFITEQKRLKSMVRNKRVNYRYHDGKTAQIEGAFARGDRRLGQVLLEAYNLGAMFDGWSDHFNPDIWDTAFQIAGLDINFYTQRERSADEKFPWDFISMGISKEFLLKEWQKSKEGITTVNCRDGCAGCGLKCRKEGREDE